MGVGVMKLKLALVLWLVLAVPASAQIWVDGVGQSCDIACNRQGMNPIVSGVYTNGQPFYICAANPLGEGFRGGFNLRPNWANSCSVTAAGREIASTPYSCLCATGPAALPPGGGFNQGFNSGGFAPAPVPAPGYAQNNSLSVFGEDDDEIIVEEASVGANCGLPRGNATGHVRRHCGGYERCDYIVDRTLFGGGLNAQCTEDFSVTYSCGSRRQRVATVANVGSPVTVPISCE